MTLASYCGAFINPLSFEEADFIQHAICIVDSQTGGIAEFRKFGSSNELDAAVAALPASIKRNQLGEGQFMMPGFIDMHTHAPQYRNLGLGLDYALLEWLQRVTFPEEIFYGRRPEESPQQHYDRVAAIYGPMVKHYLRNGTTTCCYFGSLQVEPNKVLVDQVAKFGQRALIGKTCMDCNSPPNYVESTAESLRDTNEFIDYIRDVDGALHISETILPVVTPRFALTCTREAMKGLAGIAGDKDAHIQTHMSENKEEVSFASALFPECCDYSQIYESTGLLTAKTFLAHCVHVTVAKLATLARHGVGVAHCPTSNFALNSGVAEIRAMMQAGIEVGLGSDVSGGYGLSIMDAMRQAIIASKTLHFNQPPHRPLTVIETLYLATLGGAKALKLADRIGSFHEGKQFDALIIDMSRCPVPRHPSETLHQSLQRFVFCGDDRWIAAVFVNGQSVA